MASIWECGAGGSRTCGVVGRVKGVAGEADAAAHVLQDEEVVVMHQLGGGHQGNSGPLHADSRSGVRGKEATEGTEGLGCEKTGGGLEKQGTCRGKTRDEKREKGRHAECGKRRKDGPVGGALW